MSQLVHGIGRIFQPLLDLVAAILAAFYSIIPNYPVDVALLTIVIMAALTPLTVKSTKNMAAMQALAPEMKKLQQKYKGAENRVQMNEEMMKLYKEHNVNPASGCLPMLLQMPAFIILYSVIRGITNTVTKGAAIPYTETASGINTSQASHCTTAVCAVPRYINPSTKMYHAIVAADGKLESFGMNFADKLLSHHSSLWAAIPFLLLVLASVGLQYLQMARLNARNPQAAQANPQAAMMQKYLPLIFGLIYINVAAILNVYFIVSSAIRIGTQEVLFRKGIVAGPPVPPKAGAAGGGKPAATQKGAAGEREEKALPKPKTAGGSGQAKGGGTGGARNTTAGGGATGSTNGSTGGQRGGGTKRPTGGSSRNGANGSATGSGDAAGSASKSHPRSKAKRQRKAR
jgi:YidC/Oxa1 family membrane protein insertase